MTNREALIALRDAVVAGTVRHGDFHCLGVSMQDNARAAYKGSVDAAIVFLETALPGWSYSLSRGYAEVRHPASPIKDSRAFGETPARALLIATLNALIAETDQ